MSEDITSTLLFLAQGFEDLETTAIFDVFGWTQYREHLTKVSVTTTGFHDVVMDRFGTEIMTDITLSEINLIEDRALMIYSNP